MAGKYLNGTYAAGYTLTGVYTEITVGTKGSIGGTGLLGGTSASYTITNLGRIVASSTGASGITLRAGGTLANGSNSDTLALIAGGVGTSDGPAGAGISLVGGGTIANWGTVTGGVAASSRFGPHAPAAPAITASGAGSISNSGTIAGGNGGYAASGGVGILLGGRGSIENSGTIAGGAGGLARYGGGKGAAGVAAAGNTTVNNRGSIAGGTGGAAYVLNFDRGANFAGAGGAGITLSNGNIGNWGIVAGGAGGNADFTAGNGGTGIVLTADGVVDNWGTVFGGAGGRGGTAGAGGIGVVLSGGASVSNWGTVVGGFGSSRSANDGAGIDVTGGSSGIANWGIVAGGAGFRGVTARPGGNGGAGINLSGVGSVANWGTIAGGAGGASAGDRTGVNGAAGAKGAAGIIQWVSGGVIDNYGTIAAGAGGNGGSNGIVGGHAGSGGDGGAGILVSAAAAAIINRGAIISGAGGSGGIGRFGSVDGTAGTAGSGIVLSAGGIVTNGSADGSTALISGRIGIQADGTTTVTNYGTIASASGTAGTAVYFAGASSKLILEAGSRLVGEALGGGGTLELAAAGGADTVTGIGSQYLNFASLVFDVGATWTAEGSASGLPGTITGFDPGDVIDVDGFVAVSDSYSGGGLVLIDMLGNSVTVGIQSSFWTTRDFQIAADGHGGTNITTLPAVLTLSPASDSGIKGDNITNVTNPVITGTGRPGNTLTLFDGMTVIGGATIHDAGDWSVATAALAAGSHSLTARQTDAIGNLSSPSLPLSLTIDPFAAAPAGLTLDPASDSGAKGDNITNVTTPLITGTGESGAALTLLDSATTVATTTVDATGSWSVTTSSLVVGKHTLTATETDLAGNVSSASTPLTLTIEASGSPPTTPETVAGAASQLAFFAAGSGADQVNLVLTTDGTGLPPPISGKFNIEVFTSVVGALATGYDASAFLVGAGLVAGNVVQTGTLGLPEQLLAGSYIVLDQTGREAIQVVGNPAGAATASNIGVIGSSGDTITGSTVAANSQLIDASALNPTAVGGAMKIAGGAGGTTVWGGKGDSITGGGGALQVNDAVFAGGETVTGGAGNLFVFSIGKSFSITGSTAGTTLIDDNYGKGGASTITGGSGTATGAGGLAVNTVIIGAAGDTITGGSGTTYINAINGSQAITAGSGATTVQAAAGDTIAGGKGTLLVYLDSDQATTTINLGAGHGAASLREVSVAGGKGGAVSITGFSTASDVIQSADSVAAGKFLGTSKSDGSGGTILTFVDGTTMTLAGAGDPSKITFAS